MILRKIGILTFHYSNNYGGVLQAVALQKVLFQIGIKTEILNYAPLSYHPLCLKTRIDSILRCLRSGSNAKENHVSHYKFVKKITRSFDDYRQKNIVQSKRVHEQSLARILSNYSTIIVGSDQIWNPYQRRRPEYFLRYGSLYTGKKIAYAADSTLSDVTADELNILQEALSQFAYISVRNKHSFDFVSTITGQQPDIVADPTLLYDFEEQSKPKVREPYVLVYTLGADILGTNKAVIEKIKLKYGNLKVYSVKDPTINYNFCDYADYEFYDLGPDEWLEMINKASFVYTDSYHGILFSLKYHRHFLAYYTEKLRSGRLIDVGERYGIEKYIVGTIDDIEKKKSLDFDLDYNQVDKLIQTQKEFSVKCLIEALKD